MNNLDLSLRTITGVAIAAILSQPLAGCSGATSSLPPAPVSSDSAHMYVPAAANAKGSAAQRVSPDAGGQQLFVSDDLNSKVYVYNAASKVSTSTPERTISSGVSNPNGIATDKEGNLWVTNLSSNTVTEYAKNGSSPIFTISQGMNGPVDVKVDGFGNVYVAMDGEFGGPNSIVEYAAGTADPIDSWNPPQNNMQITGIALVNPNVKNGTTVYATESQTTGSITTGGLLFCSPGSYNEVCSQLTSYLYGQTGGIAIANQGGSKPFEFLAVDQYLPGVDETITSPFSVKKLTTGGTPEDVTLNAKGTRLFVADRFYGQVEEYTFPGNKEKITFGAPGKTILIGVATDPSGNYL
ncbi:MAG: SMP-30/gluconolactonase/LRE family protein [Candidatus Cybelea sp.]